VDEVPLVQDGVPATLGHIDPAPVVGVTAEDLPILSRADAVLEDDFPAVGNRWIEERRRVRSPRGAIVARAAGRVGENGSGVDLEDLDPRVVGAAGRLAEGHKAAVG
jgi:hypothetical protein